MIINLERALLNSIQRPNVLLKDLNLLYKEFKIETYDYFVIYLFAPLRDAHFSLNREKIVIRVAPEILRRKC